MAVTAAPSSQQIRRTYRSELSPLSFLQRSAYVYPDKVAVVHGERRYTYRDLGERVNRMSSALVAAGIEPGDRVAFLAPNIPALLEAHYAVPAAGGVLVALNTRLAPAELAAIIEHSGARLLFVDHELEALVVATPVDKVRIADTGAPDDPYERFSRRRRARALRLRGHGRGSDDLDQLHVRHDRAAEGGDVHPPRRLLERPCGGARVEPAA